MLPQVANSGAEVRGIGELRPAYVDRLFARTTIEEHYRAAAVDERTRPDFKIALFPDAASLAAEGILIDGDHFFVRQNLFDLWCHAA